jgi:carboxymethylenebutenolidase
MGQIISVDTADGSFDGYLALPVSASGPGLVVLPEVYNSNEWVRAVADSYAADGYVVLAPDIYWRQGPRQYLPYTPEGQQRGRALSTVLEADIDRAMGDIGRCVETLRRRPGVNGKVGVIGYCLGGKLAFLAGARLPVDAVVIYYGVRMVPYLDEARALTAPTIMHFGDGDVHIPPEMYRTIRDRVAGMKNVAVHLYPGAGHGFARFGQSTCEPAAADLARARTLELLRCLNG